jgi:hypothetical protein
MKITYPESINLLKVENNVNLIVNGQGIIFFETNEEECSLFLNTHDKLNGLKIHFTQNDVRVNDIQTNVPLIDPYNKSGLLNKKGAYYWFSLDAQNQQLYAGVGEARIDTLIYQYSYEKNTTNKKFLESITNIHLILCKPFRLLRDPITNAIPLIIKNTDDLSMTDVALGTYLPKANLSLVAQKLYDCISGRHFVLDTPDFPDFTEAIEYNIRTPNCWCYNKLIEKSTEFNPDVPNLNETYLRITLGQNNGESPGIPYVMEIWPIGHYSPIHNHGGADAIIRVLNGTINVNLYSFLCEEVESIQPFANINFVKNDITWISPTLNQVHQLKNLESSVETCITIQCYMYENDDTTHYDYFDYIDDDGRKQQFEPDSDLDFINFKKIVKEQWENRNLFMN